MPRSHKHAVMMHVRLSQEYMDLVGYVMETQHVTQSEAIRRGLWAGLHGGDIYGGRGPDIHFRRAQGLQVKLGEARGAAHLLALSDVQGTPPPAEVVEKAMGWLPGVEE